MCSENKGADQLIFAFVFKYAKCWFSHNAAHMSDKHLFTLYYWAL